MCSLECAYGLLLVLIPICNNWHFNCYYFMLWLDEVLIENHLEVKERGQNYSQYGSIQWRINNVELFSTRNTDIIFYYYAADSRQMIGSSSILTVVNPSCVRCWGILNVWEHVVCSYCSHWRRISNELTVILIPLCLSLCQVNMSKYMCCTVFVL